jgi:hypothetical protein
LIAIKVGSGDLENRWTCKVSQVSQITCQIVGQSDFSRIAATPEVISASSEDPGNLQSSEVIWLQAVPKSDRMASMALDGSLEGQWKLRLDLSTIENHGSSISQNFRQGGPLRALKTSTWNFQPFPSQVSNRSRRLLSSHRPPQEGAEEARQQGRQQRVQPPG